MSLGALILAAAVVAFVIFLLRRGKPAFLPGMKRRGSREAELYKRLLRKSFGDAEQVERLIEVERKKRPGASRAMLIRDALERWERHNR